MKRKLVLVLIIIIIIGIFIPFSLIINNFTILSSIYYKINYEAHIQNPEYDRLTGRLNQ